MLDINIYLPALEILTIETRLEYVDFLQLQMIEQIISEKEKPVQIELAVGFEIFDDELRNSRLKAAGC